MDYNIVFSLLKNINLVYVNTLYYILNKRFKFGDNNFDEKKRIIKCFGGIKSLRYILEIY